MRTPHLHRGGFTLVELLVGLALGLFVVAAAIALLAAQAREQRSLAIQHRLMQDLRTASDVIARDLRRAGHWGAAASAVATTSNAAIPGNPYAAISPSTAASDAVAFGYSRDTVENGSVDPNETFGLRLRNGVVELLLGTAWQALTDAGTLTVTEFRVVPTVRTLNLANHCLDCATSPCPAHQDTRSFVVTLGARAIADPAVTRTLRSEVLVRNDLVSGDCPI